MMDSVTFRVQTLAGFVAGAVIAVAVTLLFVNAWRADAAPGDSDTTYVSLTPCRLIDTRPGDDRVGPLGAFGIEATQTIQARGTNGNCNIPADAVGLSLNVTAIGSTAPSFLTIWPGGDRPRASSLNPGPGQPPTPNAVVTNLSAVGAFKIFNLAGSVDVIVDINGYYTKTTLQDIESRLATAESALADKADTATVNQHVAALEAADIALQAAQPFAKTARTTLNTFDDPETIVWLSVTAPVDGHVIVNSTTTAVQTTADHAVTCSINATNSGPAAIDIDFRQAWESPGTSGEYAQMAGTRRFDITAGATDTYALVCAHSGSDNTSAATDAVLTAIFTPAP